MVGYVREHTDNFWARRDNKLRCRFIHSQNRSPDLNRYFSRHMTLIASLGAKLAAVGAGLCVSPEAFFTKANESGVGEGHWRH